MSKQTFLSYVFNLQTKTATFNMNVYAEVIKKNDKQESHPELTKWLDKMRMLRPPFLCTYNLLVCPSNLVHPLSPPRTQPTVQYLAFAHHNRQENFCHLAHIFFKITLFEKFFRKIKSVKQLGSSLGQIFYRSGSKLFANIISRPCADPEQEGVLTPLENDKDIGFLSNTGPDPLKNNK